jgi:methionyl-tRNA formyltransferase
VAPKNYLVVGCKPWNRRVFSEKLAELPGRWRYVDSPDALNAVDFEAYQPRYVFFLHWSWKVPPQITDRFECVCFHMTDVPYGRGGSPLQNLIVRGHRETRLTALRMVQSMDAGPVYAKADLSLEGNAEEILIRATYRSAEMIRAIVAGEPVPVEQTGEPEVFVRRKAAESEIPALESDFKLHDFIRMLDAEGYPPAFLDHKGFRYSFKRAALYDGRIVADVSITAIPPKEEKK